MRRPLLLALPLLAAAVLSAGCGGITPFEGRALETAIDRVSRRVRFDVGDHDVVLHGACERCRR